MIPRTPKKSPLPEIIQSQQEELDKHKGIESENTGGDISWECAAHGWSHKHFPDWKRHRLNRAIQNTLCGEE